MASTAGTSGEVRGAVTVETRASRLTGGRSVDAALVRLDTSIRVAGMAVAYGDATPIADGVLVRRIAVKRRVSAATAGGGYSRRGEATGVLRSNGRSGPGVANSLPGASRATSATEVSGAATVHGV